MAKFGLTCPHCGTVNRASTFVFAKKTIICEQCKSAIDVKDNRMAIGNCPTCGTVAFDQSKRNNRGNYKCSICNKYSIMSGPDTSISSATELKAAETTPLFSCPECYCSIQIKKGTNLACPVCDHKFAEDYSDIYSIIQKEKLVTSHSISVIKYEGDNSTFVWKHPVEDFNLGSQLIVHESQEAIFFLNGQALDTFGPGRYTLETENLPILQKAYPMPTGRQNPFHAEVYFINQTVQMGLKWGTKDRIHFIEPETGLPLDIGVSGEMNLRVCDSRRLLIKLVGSMRGITYSNPIGVVPNVQGGVNMVAPPEPPKGFAQSLREAFLPMMQTTIKANIGAIIKEQKLNILEIDQHLESLSLALREKLTPGFEEYGLTLPQFYVHTVALPEDNANFKAIRDLISTAYIGVRTAEVEAEIVKAQRQKELEKATTELELQRIEAEKIRIEASAQADAARMQGFADAEVMAAKGYTEKDVMARDVQIAYAEGIGNMGANGNTGGSVMGEMVGLGVGLAAMGTMGQKVGDALHQFSDISNNTSAPAQTSGWECSCGATGNQGKFCAECGKAKPEEWECPHCGTNNKGNFCAECGTAKPEAWTCPHCGAAGNKGRFCAECGLPKNAPAVKEAWNCSCGNTGITGKFCSECGKKKEDNE